MVHMYLRLRENIINGLVQEVLARCQVRSRVPSSYGLASSSTCVISDVLATRKEHAYFFVTAIKSCVLK